MALIELDSPWLYQGGLTCGRGSIASTVRTHIKVFVRDRIKRMTAVTSVHPITFCFDVSSRTGAKLEISTGNYGVRHHARYPYSWLITLVIRSNGGRRARVVTSPANELSAWIEQLSQVDGE